MELEVVVDVDGVVRQPRIIRSPAPTVSYAVLEALKQWRFKPGTMEGKPMPVVFHMTFNFHGRRQLPNVFRFVVRQLVARIVGSLRGVFAAVLFASGALVAEDFRAADHFDFLVSSSVAPFSSSLMPYC